MSIDALTLTPLDKASSLWIRLHAHYTARLKDLRERNDQVMTEGERNKLLGQIFEVKKFLAMGQEPRVTL